MEDNWNFAGKCKVVVSLGLNMVVPSFFGSKHCIDALYLCRFEWAYIKYLHSITILSHIWPGPICEWARRVAHIRILPIHHLWYSCSHQHRSMYDLLVPINTNLWLKRACCALDFIPLSHPQERERFACFGNAASAFVPCDNQREGGMLHKGSFSHQVLLLQVMRQI